MFARLLIAACLLTTVLVVVPPPASAIADGCSPVGTPGVPTVRNLCEQGLATVCATPAGRLVTIVGGRACGKPTT